MKLNAIDTVLFDYDGTLMDTNDIILRSWKHLFRELGEEIPPDGVLYATFGEILTDTLWDFFGGDDEHIQEYIRIYREYQTMHYDGEIRLFPGAAELLDGLKADGYKVALVTSRMKRTTMMGLEEFGIADRFDTIVTANDTSVHKPNPEPLLMALERLGSDSDRSVMLGDTWMDVEGAWNAGVTPVMCGWSLAYKYNKGSSIDPKYTIETLPELRELLNRINSGE